MKKSSTVDRSGITLVEVVASLVLLATLVVSMMLAYSSHHRQAQLAIRRQRAIQVADELLSTWYASDPPNVPRNGSGMLPSNQWEPMSVSALAWRTHIVHRNTIETLPVEVVRLELFRSNDVEATNSRASSTERKPLVQVDVMLPAQNGLPLELAGADDSNR